MSGTHGLALYLALTGVATVMTLPGAVYWVFIGDLNVDALLTVSRRLADAGDFDRLLKLSRAMPDAPTLAVIERALTLDPLTLDDPSATRGYRDAPTAARDDALRDELRARAAQVARRGHALWWLGVFALPLSFGAAVAYGPWSHRAGLPTALSLLPLGLLAGFALVTAKRSQVLGKVERVIDFAVPYAGRCVDRSLTPSARL